MYFDELSARLVHTSFNPSIGLVGRLARVVTIHNQKSLSRHHSYYDDICVSTRAIS